MTERYKIDTHGPDPQGVHLAIAKAVELADQYNCNIVLCVPSLKDAANTILTDVLSKPFVSDLSNGNLIKFRGHSIKMLSKHNIKKIVESDVIVVFLWILPKPLSSILKSITPKAIIEVPWL